MKKVGILGGTFDPPHLGHLLIANDVKHVLSLDEVWFMPNHIPPHKQSDSFTSSDLRLEMIKRAIEGQPYFQVQAIELEREGPSYTYDTILMLKENYPTVDFHFIIGADMVEYLPKWHKIEELVKLVKFVGVKRPGYSITTPLPVIEVETPQFEVSSTLIRQRIKEGRSSHYLVPENVRRMIEEKKLYE
ncbi:nicotinate-nucleotide adenylyltransferase [Bacillus tianshenii]|uniref:nicotinate-nucleotide adenylyltransferase n=1 Tax=Sutcliffiella tianshenii TaxID=1463404 RepID=UPI001CD53EAD|nr:nicotinate-nucleotide adenylyltransferase [Bacillus tianshenii]MCA1318862.1 nicotinate-nucleotide adenylyltransferase [Bacillus tianshenii]